MPQILYFLDLVSAGFVLVPVLLVLLAAKGFSTFAAGARAVFTGQDSPGAAELFGTLAKTGLCAGLAGTVYGLVNSASYFTELNLFMSDCSVALLPLFYGLLLYIVLTMSTSILNKRTTLA